MKEQIRKVMAKDLCRGKEKHTKQEYISMLNGSTKKFIENDLTDEARERIELTRQIHQKENEEDYMLGKIVREYDLKRRDEKLKQIEKKLLKKENSDDEFDR
jgi:hypothetical protein